MSYSISQSHAGYKYHTEEKKKSAIVRFFAWASAQDRENHVAWVGLCVTTMAAVFFPMTMAVILLNGASFVLIIAAMSSLTLVVVTNLAALPTKFTIPFLALGILADLVIIVIALLN